jgi:hypothetical protein
MIIINTNTSQFFSENDNNLFIKECHFEKFILLKDGKLKCISNCIEYSKFIAIVYQNWS